VLKPVSEFCTLNILILIALVDIELVEIAPICLFGSRKEVVMFGHVSDLVTEGKELL
jgi:hypothetical protein